MNTNLVSRVIKIAVFVAVAAVAFQMLFAVVQLAAMHYGWEAVGMFTFGWLAAGSGKVALNLLAQGSQRRGGLGTLVGIMFAKSAAAFFTLTIAALVVAHVFNASAAAGVPLMIGGSVAALTIFPTRLVSRLVLSAV